MKQQPSQGKEKRRVSLPIVIFCSIISMLLGMSLMFGVLYLRLDADSRSVLQAVNIIRSRFVGEYDWHEVVDDSLSYMTASLGDRWSYFLDAKDYAMVMESRANAYIGIGVTISQEDATKMFIVSVTPEGPAHQAGIEGGDQILSVEGEVVTEESFARCMEAISGPEGTTVTLEIAREGDFTRMVEVKRGKIVTNPVEYEMLADAVGYVSIRNFYTGSGEAMIAAVDDLVASGAKALVFDLRDNPGGYVLELTAMLDHLLPEGVIFQSSDLSGQEQVYTSDAEAIALPFATLVNGNSYSAAEFFAAELREKVDAFVVGERTSGKGYAQQVFPLHNGSALGLSTARYVTGQGVSLIGTGLVPDEEVSLSEEEYTLYQRGTLENDPQRQAALKAVTE